MYPGDLGMRDEVSSKAQADDAAATKIGEKQLPT